VDARLGVVVGVRCSYICGIVSVVAVTLEGGSTCCLSHGGGDVAPSSICDSAFAGAAIVRSASFSKGSTSNGPSLRRVYHQLLMLSLCLRVRAALFFTICE
jgi:hypothetical protein